MDPTTQAFLAAILGAVVAGGAVLAWHISDRQQSTRPDRPSEPVVPPEVATVLSVLRSSAVIVDDTDTVVKASAPAYALGLVRGTELVSEELDELVHEVRRDGQIRETELLIEPRRTHRPATSPPGSRRSARTWCSPWSRTAPASAGSRRYAATSSPTSATS